MENEYEVIVVSDELICGEDTVCGQTLNLVDDMIIFRNNNVGLLIEMPETEEEEEEEEENE